MIIIMKTFLSIATVTTVTTFMLVLLFFFFFHYSIIYNIIVYSVVFYARQGKSILVQEPKEKRRGSLSFNSRVRQPCRSKYTFMLP